MIDDAFWKPDPTELFWPCECAEANWQSEFNSEATIHRGKLRQSRCTVCLNVAKFFRQPKEDQAAQIKRLLNAQVSMSAWLAIADRDDANPSIPRDIARESAGWSK